MKISELKGILVGNVDVYRSNSSGDGFEDIYNGDFVQIPEKFLNLTITCMSGNADESVGISVK